ncbi:MAG: D-glycero-beta-D-manno-heptose-7-phosphate kinase [Helicobacter sp.]|nr:D-glycero-beta-D-manno-heptose-7-phosphate kinase [Helicobacter sp.]
MKPNILVIGDLILDHYVWGSCERISPEAPVQVIEVTKETLSLGGACNVANNLIALEAEVFICGMIGADEAGKKLKQQLQALHIHTQGIYIHKNRPTTKKSRIIAAHQQVLRVDKEDKESICKEGESFILDFSMQLIKNHKIDCIILSDYQKGVLSPKLTQKLITLAKKSKIKILIDPKGKDYRKYRGATLLTPNKKEVKEATNISIYNEETLLLATKKLKQMCDLEFSLITLSEDGIAVLDETLKTIPTVAKEVFDVTGAGDTVIAALAYMFALQKNILQSVYFANAAAAVVVNKIGSATASKEEIINYLKKNNLLNSQFIDADFLPSLQENKHEILPFFLQLQKTPRKIRNYMDKYINPTHLKDFTKALKDLESKIVFTNGCFDILHLGHIDYLNKAKNLGDLLIVGLNSDSSIKSLKGKDRPINSQYDRIAMLCALECIDFVIVFEEDTPLELIKKIKPDILVKGKDYLGKEIIGSNIAKEVCLIDYIEGKSSSAIIQKIKNFQARI